MDRILIIEDEKQMAQMISDYLKANDFDTDVVYDGFNAVKKITDEDYNLILMDVMIPGMDGFDVLKILRKNKKTPVIFLTARIDEADKIAALEQGADDYIVKPFSFRELVARIRAVCRRVGGSGYSKLLICGDVKLDGEKKKCYIAGVPHDLTAVQFAIVEKLMSQPGRVFSRQELVASFSGSFCDEYSRNIDAHIKNIRKILCKDGDGRSYIETVRSMGYRFREL